MIAAQVCFFKNNFIKNLPKKRSAEFSSKTQDYRDLVLEKFVWHFEFNYSAQCFAAHILEFEILQIT